MYPIRQQQTGISNLTNFVFSDYQIIRLKNPPHSTYYYRELSQKKNASHTLSYLDEETAKLILKPYLEEHLGGFSANQLNQCADTLLLSVKEEREMKDLYNLIEISPTLYWDNQYQTLRRNTELLESEVSFFKLFDSRFYTEHRPEVNPILIQAVEVMPRYYDYQNRIEEIASLTESGQSLDFSSLLPEELNFMNAWTKDNPDVLSDILRMIATIFMKRKPLGSFCLIGKARGGKSACVNMLHTMLGSRNTSLVKMSQLADDHYTHQLLHSLLNAPDEEDDTTLDRQQANFKVLADHGTLTLSRMGSNEPLYLTADFTSIFPMNHMPEWKGSGTEACMRRTLAIPFLADLSVNDNRSMHFERDTYTARMYAHLIPLVLAIASFYSREGQKMVFSPTMQGYQRFMEEETSSASVYFKLFERYFNGFTTVSFLYTDYVNWCKINEYRMQTRKEFQFFFSGYLLGKPTTRVVQVLGRKTLSVRCYVGQKPYPIMHPDMQLVNMKQPLGAYHEIGGSVMERMQKMQEQRNEW
nr:MAG TPA: DNA helicase [Caudoviricetes sp.]